MYIVHKANLFPVSIEHLFSVYILFFFLFLIFISFSSFYLMYTQIGLFLNYLLFFFLINVTLDLQQQVVFAFDYSFPICLFFCDSLSILFLLMVSYIMPCCLIYCYRNISLSRKAFILCILWTELFVLLCFSSRNFLIFYINFELTLIPMFILIYFYGTRGRKVYASFIFFLYTFVGSLFLIIGLLFVLQHFDTLEFVKFTYYSHLYKVPFEIQCFIFSLLFIGFAIKVPIMPFHSWLPEAHVEAPTVGSVMLAAILLKLGGFGILRVLIPLFHNLILCIRPILISFCIISCIYACFLAYRHYDIKKIIAYSSIMHMNFSLLGLWTESKLCFIGSIIAMLSHSLTSAGLFFIAGFLYEKFHTRNVLYYSHLYTTLSPLYVLIFLFILINLAFPITLTFIGEFYLYVGFSKVLNILFLISGVIFLFSGIFGFVLFYRLIYSTNHLHINVIKLKKIQNLSVYPHVYYQSDFVFVSWCEILILSILITPLILLFFFNDVFLHLINQYVNLL